MFVYFLIRFFLQKVLGHRYYSSPEAKQEVEFEKTKEKKEVIGNVWCELDGNLLGEIKSRLCCTGEARFSAVCKSWLTAHRINTPKSLPFYLKFDRSLPVVSNGLEFQLYDPSYSITNPVSVHSISLTKLGMPSPFSWSTIGATRIKSWLFICLSRPRFFFSTPTYFLLFSPFSKKVIALPKLDYPYYIKFRRTFSTDPNSPNCVFFLSNTFDDDKIVVITYRNGDKDWNAREFHRVDEFLPCDSTPYYFRGIFYIVSAYGQLASYNSVDGEFKFECLSIDFDFAVNYNCLMIYDVFELNGELMLIYFGSNKTNNDTFPGLPCIKQYDWSNKVWIPVSNLGDKALFVSDKIVSVATINGEEASYNGVLSSKVYHFFYRGCLIYSLEDGYLVEFKYINLNFMVVGSGDLLGYKYNLGITFGDHTKAFYWFEPPVVLY